MYINTNNHNNKNRCGSAKEWKRATEIFDEARYVHRLRPSLQIYGALLGALAEAGRWADVLAYLDRMVADGLVPDAAATNTAVLAAAELGDGRRALSLLEGEGSGRGGGAGELQRRQRQLEAVREGEGGGDNGCSGDDGILPRDRRSRMREAVPHVDRNGKEEQEDEALLQRGKSATEGLRNPKEQGEGGAPPARSIWGGEAVPRGGGVAAAVRAPKTAGTAPEVAEEPKEGGVRPAEDGDEAGTTGSGEVEEELDRAVRGAGWETATPGLLNSVLHALDEAGEDGAVLEAVKRGREKGVLLNLSIYR